MTLINDYIFKGELPRLSDKLLPEGFAKSAINCDFRSGNLKPAKDVTFVQALQADTESIFLMVNKWLEWDERIYAVYSTMSASNYRLVFTELGNYPQETDSTLAIPGAAPYPNAVRRLGITTPPNAPTVAVSSGSGTDTVIRTSAYVYTRVAIWADGTVVESGPSPASAIIDIPIGDRCLVSNLEASVVTGEYSTHFRLYRVVAGEEGAEFVYVTEFVKATTSYTDDNSDADLSFNEVIETTDWTSPNVDMDGLVKTSYGLYFGFDDNIVYVSESYIPYAYPSKYTLMTTEIIKGFGVTPSAVICVTRGRPYLITGQDPSALSLQQLPFKQACVSALSIVSMPQGVVYATPDGLFLITGGGAGVLLTKKTYTKEQWAALGPDNIFAFHYDKYYLAFWSDGTGVIRLDMDTGEIVNFTLSTAVHGGFYDSLTDVLYLIKTNGAGRDLVSWDSGSEVSLTWQSRVRFYADTEVFQAARVLGDFSEGDPTIKIYGDGVLLKTATPTTPGELIRLPRKKVTELYYEITGEATIDNVRIGSSADEVYNVSD